MRAALVNKPLIFLRKKKKNFLGEFVDSIPARELVFVISASAKAFLSP